MESTQLPVHIVDYVVIIGYFAGILAFGSYFGRYAKTTSDFFFGGRRFSWWLICVSIVATGVGSHSFIKYSAKGFQHGFSSTMTYMNDWFFMPFFMFGWLMIIYYTRVRSIPEYFENRFNRPTRILATIMMLMYMIGYVAIGFLTLGTALYKILGWPLYPTIIFIAVISAIYMTYGGQTSVIFTDLIQGLILLFAGILLFVLGINFLGGWDAFWDLLPVTAKLPLADFSKPPDFNFVGIFWQDGIAGSVGFLFLSQGLIMRFMACRSVNEGRKAAAMNVLFFLPISAVAVSSAGWIGKAISISNPGLIPPDFNADDIFTKVTFLVAQPGIAGFIIAALSAALMSTIDTHINATAAVFINDIYRPLKKGRNSDKDDLRWARYVSLGGTALALALVPIFASFKTIYEAHGWFHSTLTPPLVVAVFLGIFWKRFTPKAAVATFVGGGIMIILGQNFPELVRPFSHGIQADPGKPYIYIGALYNLFWCFTIGIIVTLFTKPKDYKLIEGLTVWTVHLAKIKFKGGKPNETPGKKPIVHWKTADLETGLVSLSAEDMKAMDAYPGDLVYLCDKRAWLGGLKSVHAKMGESHEEEGVVYMTKEMAKNGLFTEGKKLFAEKEL